MAQADTEVVDDEVQTDQQDEAADEVEQTEVEQPGERVAVEDEEVTVTFGEESPTSEDEEQRKAPPWVQELRKSSREKDRQIRELREQLNAVPAPTKAVEVGAKPTLEACEYDTERFERDLEAWHQRKRDQEAQEAKKREAADAEQKSWQARLDAHNKLKGELKVKDYEDAEASVEEAMSVTQRGVIIHGAKNSATLLYALGKNPKKLKELAAIQDPVKFAFAAAELETQLKVSPRKSAPLPERTVRGSAPMSGAVDSNLERLRAAAEKSGDYSQVQAYRRQLRERSK